MRCFRRTQVFFRLDWKVKNKRENLAKCSENPVKDICGQSLWLITETNYISSSSYYKYLSPQIPGFCKIIFAGVYVHMYIIERYIVWVSLYFSISLSLSSLSLSLYLNTSLWISITMECTSRLETYFSSPRGEVWEKDKQSKENKAY